MLILTSLLLGALAGIFLKWWILAIVLGIQVVVLFNLAFPSDDRPANEELLGKFWKTVYTSQVPVVFLYAAFQHKATILSLLSSTIR